MCGRRGKLPAPQPSRARRARPDKTGVGSAHPHLRNRFQSHEDNHAFERSVRLTALGVWEVQGLA